ncbi:MAG: PleD family two-component system response regulator [Endomicrobiia bacterium]
MPKKILIAEDKWELKNLLKLILEDYDLDIIESEEGIQTIEIAKIQKPDLIMLDNCLPGFPGYELVPRIKAIPEIANIPIILLASKKIEEEMQSMVQLEVVDIISKPYEEDKIISSLRKVFGTVPKKSFAQMQKFSDIEKTVVLSPEELPFKMQEASKEIPPEPPVYEPRFTISQSKETISDVEKTVVLPPEELPVKEIQPPTEPKGIGFEEEKTVILQKEELPIVEQQKPSISIQETAQSQETAQPEISKTTETIPSETVARQPTKYYTVSGISIKEFFGCLFNIPVGEKIQKHKTFLVIAYGLEIIPEELFNFIDVFSESASIVSVDYEIFYEKIKELKSLGAEIFEVEPSALKKI